MANVGRLRSENNVDINADEFSEIAVRAIQPIILGWLRQVYIRGQNEMRDKCVAACVHKQDAELLKHLRVETFRVIGRPTLHQADAGQAASDESGVA